MPIGRTQPQRSEDGRGPGHAADRPAPIVNPVPGETVESDPATLGTVRGGTGASRGDASGGAERSEASELPSAPGTESKDSKDPVKQDNTLEIIKGEELSTEITKELEPNNVRDELPKYEFPSLELLEEYSTGRHEVSEEELTRNNNKIGRPWRITGSRSMMSRR